MVFGSAASSSTAAVDPRVQADDEAKRLWAPGEAEAVLRAELAKLGLSEEQSNQIVLESLGGCFEDNWSASW